MQRVWPSCGVSASHGWALSLRSRMFPGRYPHCKRPVSAEYATETEPHDLLSASPSEAASKTVLRRISNVHVVVFCTTLQLAVRVSPREVLDPWFHRCRPVLYPHQQLMFYTYQPQQDVCGQRMPKLRSAAVWWLADSQHVMVYKNVGVCSESKK